ncbi:hypothetical protein DSO57_1035745 [Entomophthora muscae]|uniref:Uncharacterized protein n=1 Tax=Entomophthora muscae TaxID=34485 RepID=A0ACC2RE59_9FUNG|nr:hypothetical protein DSO57_1035745 [Entomophthora muscae]
MDIPDTYSCVINKLSPAATKQTSAVNMQTTTVTKQKSTTNVQTSAAIKQMITATAQAPTTLASLTCKPSSNQAPMGQPATCQPLPFHASRPVPIHSFGK